MPGKWRKESDRRTTYQRGNEDEGEGRGARSRIEGMQEGLRLDWIHGARTKMEDEGGRVDAMRDMEKRGGL